MSTSDSRSSSWILPLLLILSGLPAAARAQGIDAVFPPFDDAQTWAIAVLDSAQSTVDVAQYNIRNQVFRDALLRLRARGVAVRIVVDAKNARKPYNTLDDRLEQDGFALHRYENTTHAYAIMHHKFTVVDGAVVMSGSYNWNETAQLVNDENMVVLHDPALAAAYTAEFEELWNEGPDVPAVGVGQLAEVHFSPEDRPRDAILAAIAGAQFRVRVAMFSFRDDAVARALRDAARRGVEVTLLTEKKQADTTHADEVVASGGARVIVGENTSSAYSAMHEKYAVVDDGLVITGACNWTYTAFQYSNEDLLLIRDAAVARRYTEAFAALVHRYDPAGYVAADYGVQQPEATVQFVVDCPGTAWGETLWVTGDDPALGDWDPALAVALNTTDGIFPTWTGRVRLPAGAHVHWKAVLRGPAGNGWELGADRLLEVDASGTNHVELTVFRALVDVTVSATLPALPAGGELRLVGADPSLGSWDPDAGTPLQPDPSLADRFVTTLPFPGRSRLPCKLVLVAADGTVTWEQGDDRSLEVWDRDAPQAFDLGAFRR